MRWRRRIGGTWSGGEGVLNNRLRSDQILVISRGRRYDHTCDAETQHDPNRIVLRFRFKPTSLSSVRMPGRQAHPA